MQNTMQLAKALQEKKKDFEMMMYPGGKHGWGGTQHVHFENAQVPHR